MRPRPALALALAFALLGCARPEAGDDGAAREPGTDRGEDGAPAPATILALLPRALDAARALDPDARVTGLRASVDANGSVVGALDTLAHLHGPASYPDAWRSEHADAGRFLHVIVDASSGGVEQVALAPGAAILQGVLADAGAPTADSPTVVEAARTVLPPGPDGTWTLTFEPFACGGGVGASWAVSNGALEARVDAAAMDVCAPPANPLQAPALRAVADVPHGTFPLLRNGSVVVAVDVHVEAAPPGGARLALALSSEGPEGSEPRPGSGVLPPGFHVASAPDVARPAATGALRFNLTISADASATEGFYRFVVHVRSDARRFSAGVDEPLRVVVRSS